VAADAEVEEGVVVSNPYIPVTIPRTAVSRAAAFAFFFFISFFRESALEDEDAEEARAGRLKIAEL
jgi:hypothetical protein